MPARKKSFMAATSRSKRFKPNLVTEKIVPVVLVLLLVILLAVFIVIGLSLAGVFPAS
jgi:hypothetical protein